MHAIHYTSFTGLLTTKLPHSDISPSLYVCFYGLVRVCKVFAFFVFALQNLQI